jgi:hypothetical protein
MTTFAVELHSGGVHLKVHVEAEGLGPLWRFLVWRFLPAVLGGMGLGVGWHFLGR